MKIGFLGLNILYSLSSSAIRRIYIFIRRNIRTILFILLGTIFILVGALGLILPVIPGIPLIILGIASYMRAFGKIGIIIMKTPARKLINKQIPSKAKIAILIFIWLYLFAPAVIFTKNQWVWIISASICVVLTGYIMKVKSFAEIVGLEEKGKSNSQIKSAKKEKKDKSYKI
jgi:uncharacterized membrane protein YbaN (DUF454 family)